MRIELEVKSATLRSIESLKTQTGLGKIKILQLALAIGLVGLAKEKESLTTHGRSKLTLDLGRIDPTHAIEISAYEVLFSEARRQKADAFYIGSDGDLARVLSPALDRGCAELMKSNNTDLRHFITEKFWPDSIHK